MKKLLTLSLLALFSLGVQAQTYYYISDVEITPENPTPDDEVCITIHGELSSGTKIVDFMDYGVNGWDIDIQIDAADEGGFGIMIMIEFDTTICLGSLPEGNYNVNISGQYTNFTPDYTNNFGGGFGVSYTPPPGTSTSINETEAQELGAYFFPNPASENLTVVMGENQKNTQLKLYSIDGKLAHSEVLNANKTFIDISQLNKGIYFLELNQENGKNIMSRKVVISE